MAAITGIDASRHQGTVDWAAVRRAGHTFAFVKATEGTAYSYVSWYRTNAPKVRDAGLVLGAYHFLRADRDPAQQARYYLQTVGSLAGVVPIVDVETAANGTMPKSQHVRAFVDQFRQLAPGRQILIYTGRWYWVGHMGNPPGADLGPLWHSEYETTQAEIADGPELDNYGGWIRALVWQYTSTGRCPGVSGNCDLNIFFGTTDQLQALAGSTQEAPLQLDADDQQFIKDQVQRLGDKLMLGIGNPLFPPDPYGQAATLPKILAAVGQVGDVDEQAIANAILAGLNPTEIAEMIATAVGPQLAEDVADELHARLAS